MKQTGSLARTSEETQQKLIALYMQGFSQNHLEKELKMSRRTMRMILGAAGIKRDRSQQSYYHHLHNTLREDAFDVITDESAYWIGFMYADGYITNPETTTSLGVLLQEGDKTHLEKLKEFLQAPHEIYHDKVRKNVRIKIGSQRLHKRLQDLGFTHNKSYDAKPPEFLKYNRHFWRGVIDGDGCLDIITNNYGTVVPRIHLCGTKDMVEGFKDFLVKSGVDTESSVRRGKGETLHSFYISSGLAKGATRILYDDAKTYLDRKFELYQKFAIL